MSLEFPTNLAGDSYILLDFGAPLEGAELNCLLCSTTTQLIGFDPKILEDEVCELRNLISEITSLGPDTILPSDEDNTTFCCPSCVTKIQVLKETYESAAKFQHQLKCLSTAIAYQLLQKQLNRQYEDLTNPVHSTTDTEIEWNEQFHEWNERRLESQVLENHLQSEILLDIGQEILAHIHRDESDQIVNLNYQMSEQANEVVNPEGEAFQPNCDNIDDATADTTESSAEVTSEQAVSPEMSNVDTSGVTSYCSYTEVTEDPGHQDDKHMRMKEAEDALEPDDNTCDMEVQHSRLEFPCTQCSRLFGTEKGLNEHIRRKHGPAKKYPCSSCKKVYVQEHSLIYHTNTVHGTQEREKDESRACPYCAKAMSTRYYLLCHVFKHRKEFPNKQFPCKTCKKEFQSVELLLAHLTVHRGRFECIKPGCLRRFITSFELTQHLAIHEKVSKIFSCDFCRRSFMTQSELEVHIVVKHETLFNPEITCEACNESFPTLTVLKTHMKSHVPTEYNCEFCDKSYRTRWEFKSHQTAQHRNDQPYPCNECDSTFKTKLLLEEHLKRHPRFRYKCDLCTNESGIPKRFAKISDYWSHVGKKHPGNHARSMRRYCETCLQSFNTEEECAQHKLAHSTTTSSSSPAMTGPGPWRLSVSSTSATRSPSPTAFTLPSASSKA